MRRLIYLVIGVLFIVTAIIVGTILALIPREISRYLGQIIIAVTVLWLLWLWFKWRAKERDDPNDLEVLEETVREHEQGKHDNTEYIKQQIYLIERDHNLTPEVKMLLERARNAIQ